MTTVEEATLERIRVELREQVNRKLQLADLEQQVKDLKAEIYAAERNGLVDMFNEAGVDNLGLPPMGNHPGYDATLKPYFKANIATAWPDERKEEAFTWLEDNAAGDLIKATITIRLPLKSNSLRHKLIAILDGITGIEYSEQKSVPHMSLTAFIKNLITKKNKMPPLELLGADVGHIVELSERKQEK